MEKMKTMKIILAIITCSFFLNKLFAQESNGEIIPCEEIRIMCSQSKGGNYIIKSETEYHAQIKNRSPHPDCSSYELPTIDFTKYTLLGIVTGTYGCSPPTVEHNVYYTSFNNTYLFELKVKRHGDCLLNLSFEVWCLVPKIPDGSNVEFKGSELQ